MSACQPTVAWGVKGGGMVAPEDGGKGEREGGQPTCRALLCGFFCSILKGLRDQQPSGGGCRELAQESASNSKRLLS